MRALQVFPFIRGWAVLATGLACPLRADAHAGAFILAKCHTGPAGLVTLTLSVDCGQHPVLTSPEAAREAMRHVLQLEPTASDRPGRPDNQGNPGGSRGPAMPLSALAAEKQISGTVPDPGIPLPPEPGDESRVHKLELLEYSWQTSGSELNFSVPEGNPHDVLFWLSGDARPADGPVPWRILIAGDRTPPVPMGVAGAAVIAGTGGKAGEEVSANTKAAAPSSRSGGSAGLSVAGRWGLAGIALVVPVFLVWVLRRRSRVG